MDQYDAQLLSVEQALQVTEGENERKELQALRENLIELISLTQLADGEKLPKCESGRDELDNEMQRFKREVNEIDYSREDVQNLKDSFEKMVGEKCSAPHKHTWGAVAYHNAIICGIDDEVSIDDEGNIDVRFHILFTNPTHREMMPCSYYLDGDCRFNADDCHYSHGELVSATDVREYAVPDFSRLSRNCVVLAKLDDHLWHRGRVLCVNFVEKQCLVRLDSRNNKDREKDFNFEDLLPILQGDEDLSSDSDTEQDYRENVEGNTQDYKFFDTFTYTLTQPLGDWEKHTRGIGSKLMARMGYIYGTGLGSDGRGIITPVTAQILPPGCSLDYCMGLREAANGDKDLFSVEKKLRKERKKQETINSTAYERESKQVDVFTFLNDKVLTKNSGCEEPSVSKKPSLHSHSSKSLNVESVRVADDIRRKEREIAEVQKSIKRNAKGSIEICKRLNHTLQAKTAELNSLQREQKYLSTEQASRKTKEKLCVF